MSRRRVKDETNPTTDGAKLSDLYEKITNRIIDQLTQGVVPWKSPYFSTTGIPKNFATQKEYQGINVLLLGSQRFTSPYYLTFLQAKELGGMVRKGEHGFLVVKYGTYTKDDEKAHEDDPAKLRGYLKGYTVFHASQIDGIEFPEPPAASDLSTTEKTDRARAIIESMPQRPSISEGSAVPCYRKLTDSIHMPELGYFTNEEAYYSTLFHELGHATGHHSRLARKSLMDNKGFGATGDTARKTYAEEELVAEMTASFLSAHAGIIEDELENSAAYLQSWINALRTKDARSWIVRAASQGQKAADFIMGRNLNLGSDVQTPDPKQSTAGGFVEKLEARKSSSQQGRSR
ncbi:ArdC family protein [Luteolibacter algae]|uniref:ArdC family protein n=1 Tax=Luteolibacter algae TaxID=454151 RepID=A0ABW5DB64_9BACT